jgi:hypothetical protein
MILTASRFGRGLQEELALFAHWNFLIARKEKSFVASKPLVYLFAAWEGKECLRLVDDYYQFVLPQIGDHFWNRFPNAIFSLSGNQEETIRNSYWKRTADNLSKRVMSAVFRDNYYCETIKVLFEAMPPSHESQNYTQDDFSVEFRTCWDCLYHIG